MFHLHNLPVISYSCQPSHTDLDVSDIENLRLEIEKHKKNIEGMSEALKKLQRQQRQLEDEEANIHKQKVHLF